MRTIRPGCLTMSKQTILQILPRRLYLSRALCVCTMKHGVVGNSQTGENAGDGAGCGVRSYQTPLLTCLRMFCWHGARRRQGAAEE